MKLPNGFGVPTGTIYNYLQATDREEDDEETRRLINYKEPRTMPARQRLNSREIHSPISPFTAHQNLKRTKTKRKAEERKQNYKRKLSEWSNSNFTLYNKSQSGNQGAFDGVDSPYPSTLEDQNNSGYVMHQPTPEWHI